MISGPAYHVLGCLGAMGEKQTNPVLEVIPGDDKLVENWKYPHDKLSFNHSPWRAYYHCHSREHRFNAEHGHFHIFYRFNDLHWTHIAGLCMDMHGQPIRWFTVNRWVTGDTWQPAEQLYHYLKNISIDKNLSLVEQWLLSMLQLYKKELGILLEARDQRVAYLQQGQAYGEVLDNRDYYMLTEIHVDLQQKLAIELIDEAVPD